MEIPLEALQAVARAKEHLQARKLAVGEPITCRRMEIPPDHPANLLTRLPEPMKGRAEAMLGRIPEEKKSRSHWLLVFHDPPTAQRGDQYIATWLNVFDDGTVDLKAQVRLEAVHVFVASGRFHSDEELRTFLDPSYDQDGKMVSSMFMREVELSDYEPGAIEAATTEALVPLAELLARMSYAEEWLGQVLDQGKGPPSVDTVVCLFAPNRVANPRSVSLEYLGLFEYTRDRLA